MADKNGNFRVREHFRRHPAKHDCRNPAPSMRGHDDEIASSLLGGLNNAFVGMVLLDLHCFADYTSRASLFRDAVQDLLRVGFGTLGVQSKSFRHFINSRSGNRVDVERSLYGQRRDFCSDCFGERQSMAHRRAGKLRTVGWDQNMPIHAALSIAQRATTPATFFWVVSNLQEEDGGRRAPSSVPRFSCGCRTGRANHRRSVLSNGLIWMLRAFSDPHDRLKAGNRQERSVAEKRRRRSRKLAIAISAAGVTIRVRTVAKPRPKTIAVDRLIHHCVAGAPTVISRARNSTFMPNAIGSTPRIAVTGVRTTGRARSRHVSMIAS